MYGRMSPASAPVAVSVPPSVSVQVGVSENIPANAPRVAASTEIAALVLPEISTADPRAASDTVSVRVPDPSSSAVRSICASFTVRVADTDADPLTPIVPDIEDTVIVNRFPVEDETAPAVIGNTHADPA